MKTVKKDFFKKNLKIKGKVLTCGTILAMSLFALGGCGQKVGVNADTKSSSDSGKVKKIIVGSGNSYNPYCYLDDNGKAVGYEYELLKEVDKLLPDYEFEYKTMSFDSLLLSLESGKIDVAAHQFEYTDEREKKYLFGKEPYTTYITYISVLTSNNSVKSLEDLAGEKVRTGGTTSASTTIVKNYNDKHPDKAVEIVSSSNSTDEEVVAALKSGAAKATVLTKRDVEKYNKNYGKGKDFLKVVGKPINNSKTYYVYRKDETKLQKKIDSALKKLKENGKLKELSIKYLGGDYTESE